MSIETRTVCVLAEQLGVPEQDIKPESGFIKDLGCDSLDLIEFRIALEDEFGIDVDDDEFDKIATVQQVFDYLNKHPKVRT